MSRKRRVNVGTILGECTQAVHFLDNRKHDRKLFVKVSADFPAYKTITAIIVVRFQNFQDWKDKSFEKAKIV